MTIAKPVMVSNPAANRGGYATPVKKQAIVFHITDGTSSLGWLTGTASGVSANYLIDRDGTIHELVPWTEAAWVQGVSQEPDTSNPLIADWVARGVNFNTVATGIECEGKSTWGKPGALTTAQRVSLIALTAWLCQEQGHACDRTHVIRHAQLQRIDRAGCPGYAESEMGSWIDSAYAQLRGGGTPVPSADPGFPGALQSDGSTKLGEVDFGGVAVCVEEVIVQVRNAAGDRYRRIWLGHALGPWLVDD